MKKYNRIIALLLALVVCLSVFAGCRTTEDKGNDGEIDDEGNYRPSDDVAQVEFWINGDEYELAVFTDLVNRFNALYEGQIHVDIKQKPSDGYETAVRTALMGSKLDIFYVGDAGYKAYAEEGLLYDTDSPKGSRKSRSRKTSQRSCRSHRRFYPTRSPRACDLSISSAPSILP